MESRQRLPWRGPGEDRPGLPLPPDPMPLRSDGQTRKRWRYVGLYGPEVMLCMVRAQVGPFGQCFWALWDRQANKAYDHTSMRPGSHEVRMAGPEVSVDARRVRIRLRLEESTAIESICPSGSSWGWTRKRAGVPTTGRVEIDGKAREISGLAVDDESAGYHRRHTHWHWSAGVGRAVDGRPVAWNLVEGINDPPRNSERSIWVGGEPFEPPPVSFRGLDGVGFSDDSALVFASESERARDDNLLLFRSTYRHRFGAFSGSLEGLPLRDGFGVMEEHDARW